MTLPAEIIQRAATARTVMANRTSSHRYAGDATAHRGRSPCFDLIERHQRKEKNGTTPLLDAMRYVGKIPECNMCDPDTCYKRHVDGDDAHNDQNTEKNRVKLFKYWRFDQVPLHYNVAAGLVLPSIPDRLRVPPSRFRDVEAYIRELYANPDPKNTSNSFLSEYNPSLAVIPAGMKSSLPRHAKYIASMRVSPNIHCFPREIEDALEDDIKQTMHSVSHLGVAGKYQVIPGFDVVIDLAGQLDIMRSKWMGEPALSDYRLFVLNGELYLNINADTVIVTRVKLLATEYVKHSWFEGNADEVEPDGDEEEQLELENLHGGDRLKVILLHQFNSIWGGGREHKKWKNYDKNYALFSPPNNDGKVYAEVAIYPEHKVMEIVPDEYDQQPNNDLIKQRLRRNFLSDSIVQRRVKAFDVTTSGKPILPTFFTADEHWFPGKRNPFKEFSHGGSCCVSISLDEIEAPEAGRWGGIDSLLVGVGHNVIMYPRKKETPGVG